MPDLNDFYAFKMTSSGGGSGSGRNTTQVAVTAAERVVPLL